ncbi:MAG: cytochrome c3 family protein [bacterium]
MKKSRQIFPKWANHVPMIVGLSLFSLLSFVVFVFWYWFSPKHLNVGYQPEQPIPFSHRLHAGELGLDCRYCHTQVQKAGHSNIPATETCMNCHSVIKTDSPHIKKLHESYANDEPIPWVRIHSLPDYTYFNHSRHVNSGISCVSCHGRVDQMEVVRQVEPLSMGWCLDCHRKPEKHLRPVEFVTKLDWHPKEDQLTLGKRLKKKYDIQPKEYCSTCHR